MKRIALLFAFATAAMADERVRICDKTDVTRCVVVNADGSINISGTIATSGAADTVGSSATYNANSVCATVALAGQLGAGFFLGSGTLDGTLTPALSEDATMPTCSGGTWTASRFVDTSGNSAATIVVTNPNAFQQFGIATLAGSRCARVCTTTWNSGSATGFLVATTVPSPPPAAGADVTDRAGRLVGHVTVDTAPTTAVTGPLTDAQLRATAVPISGALTDTQLRASPVPVSGPLTDAQLRASAVPVSNASLPLPSNAAKETGGNLDSLVAKDFATQTTLAQIKTDVDKIPASPSTDRTTAAAPFSVRISDGAAFLDPRDISDRAARLLGVLSTGSNTIGAVTQSGTWTVQQGTPPWSASQSGTWTVQPGNTANTTAWKVDGSAVTQPISAVSLPLPLAAASDATVAETHAVSLGSIPTRQDMIAGSDYGTTCNGGACSQIPRVDANGNQYTGVTNIVRVQVSQPMNALLQRCNAVRRTNCQP